MTTPQDELRAAARLLRETYKTAFHDRPWENTEDVLWVGGPTWGYRITKEGTLTEGDAAWITLTQPALAEPLAAWLEDAAETYEALLEDLPDHYQARIEPMARATAEHALAVARTISGRSR